MIHGPSQLMHLWSIAANGALEPTAALPKSMALLQSMAARAYMAHHRPLHYSLCIAACQYTQATHPPGWIAG
eukprot:1143553-Pelagomonas_calceolata.AAC.2